VDEKNAPRVIKKIDYIITSKETGNKKVAIETLAKPLKIAGEMLAQIFSTDQKST
jgi:hypothetical protein